MPEAVAYEALSAVEKTLFLPLWGRANYASRGFGPDDPLAQRLLARAGFDAAHAAAALGDYGVLAFGRRAAVVDGAVRGFLSRNPAGQVIALGAGLDTVFERVDNGFCRSIAVDYAPVVVLRDAWLPVHPRQRNVSGDLLDPDWLCAAMDLPTIVVLSGVSMYLTSEGMQTLLTRLEQSFTSVDVVFDALSPFGVALTNFRIQRSRLTEAPVHFGLRRGDDLLRERVDWSVVAEDDLFRGSVPWGAIAWRARAEVALARVLGFSRMFHIRFRRFGLER